MAAESRFEWDPRKSDYNRRKHGIDFELAKRVFNDPLCNTEIEGHDHGEVRWRTTGSIGWLLVVLVCHTIREEDESEIVRIISARRATSRERKRYEGAL